MAEAAVRTSPLDGRLGETAGVSIVPAGPATRLSLRAPADSVSALSKALGVRLPEKPKTSEREGERAALWLGPDEWLVIDGTGGDLSAACARVSALHAAVDISHRNTAILVSGPEAEAVLSASCPQDLSPLVFPVGAVSRTVFGKTEIVLWRTERNAFRFEVWRSFADYAFMLLSDAARRG